VKRAQAEIFINFYCIACLSPGIMLRGWLPAFERNVRLSK
jgi:hypothetical protein